MGIRVLLFGRLAEIAGKTSVTVEDVTDFSGLRLRLEVAYPELKELKYLVAVDKQVVTDNIALTQDMIVALLPPFSGG